MKKLKTIIAINLSTLKPSKDLLTYLADTVFDGDHNNAEYAKISTLRAELFFLRQGIKELKGNGSKDQEIVYLKKMLEELTTIIAKLKANKVTLIINNIKTF